MARGKKGKHGVKQVDRMRSNPALKVWNLFKSWVPFVIAERTGTLIALDWTDDDDDDQTALIASLVTKHGRPTPLVWLTMQKSTLTSAQGEKKCAEDWVPKAVQMRRLRGACVTAEEKQVGAVVCV